MLQIQDFEAFYIRLCLDHGLKRMDLKKGLPRIISSKVGIRKLLLTSQRDQVALQQVPKQLQT